MKPDGALKMKAAEVDASAPGRDGCGGGILAAGGLVPATLSMTCCILPFIFVILGVSGSWIAYLTALSPYQPLFLGIASIFVAAGLWAAYRPAACTRETCAAPTRGRSLVRIALWLAAAQVVTASAVNLLAPYLL